MDSEPETEGGKPAERVSKSNKEAFAPSSVRSTIDLMVYHNLCDPCASVLKGDIKVDVFFKHHAVIGDLHQSMRRGCPLCAAITKRLKED